MGVHAIPAAAPDLAHLCLMQQVKAVERHTIAAAVHGERSEALKAFADKPNWQKLMINGMNKDFSWKASAREYVKIYERVAAPKPSQGPKVLEFSRA